MFSKDFHLIAEIISVMNLSKILNELIYNVQKR